VNGETVVDDFREALDDTEAVADDFERVVVGFATVAADFEEVAVGFPAVTDDVEDVDDVGEAVDDDSEALRANLEEPPFLQIIGDCLETLEHRLGALARRGGR
jgi:hypothetical protein